MKKVIILIVAVLLVACEEKETYDIRGSWQVIEIDGRDGVAEGTSIQFSSKHYSYIYLNVPFWDQRDYKISGDEIFFTLFPYKNRDEVFQMMINGNDVTLIGTSYDIKMRRIIYE
jgi:hypothetical protein